MEAKRYIAADLGASSGRTIVATFKNGALTLKEMNRFWNGPTPINGTLYWDFVYLFRNILEGIALAKKEFGESLVSIGVDTWGVDFGLLDSQGKLLGNPVNYRDARTDGIPEKVFDVVGKETVFNQTGIQFMQLNTLYQLVALARNGNAQYARAGQLLFAPDLLNYWLTGRAAANRTFASTSQCYNPVTKDWAFDLLEKLNLRTDLFAPFADPGTVLGNHQGLSVVNVGSHDTASAFAAVPVAGGERCAFLSSGTWSLLGTELSEPVINDQASAANFTNEVGVCDTIRFLKNLSGLWIIQELRRVWAEQGFEYTWNELAEMALLSAPFEFFINPADDRFVAPGDMPTRIRNVCEQAGQAQPETHGQLLRAAYEGLAFLYADTYGTLEQLSGKQFDTLRIVGGGCQNKALSQFAADAIGRDVVTGPVEATAIGNIIMQMLAMGDIASLAEGREIIRNSFAHEAKTYHPQDVEAWQVALEKWKAVCI